MSGDVKLNGEDQLQRGAAELVKKPGRASCYVCADPFTDVRPGYSYGEHSVALHHECRAMLLPEP